MLEAIVGGVWEWARQNRRRAKQALCAVLAVVLVLLGGAAYALSRPASPEGVCDANETLTSTVGRALGSSSAENDVFDALGGLASKARKLPDAEGGASLKAAAERLEALSSQDGVNAGEVLAAAAPVTAFCSRLSNGAAAPSSGRNGAEPTRPAEQAPQRPAASPQGPVTAAKPVGRCTYTMAGRASRPAPLPPAEPPSPPSRAVLTTNLGKVTVELDRRAPCTVNSFLSLASNGFFDTTPCHRLTSGAILRVVQCGDPTGTGTGGPGYSFADENLAGSTYPRGTLAMANSGPATNGSQFFLVYGDSKLPPSYTVFGTIVEGLEVLDQVAAAGSDSGGGAGDGKPLKGLTLVSVKTP